MDKKEIEKTILKETQEEFSKKVDDLIWQLDISTYEAVVILMEKNHYEPEVVAKLLTPVLKAQIEQDLKNLHLMKKPTKKK